MGRNLSILAAVVTAMAFGLAGVGLTAEPASPPLQLAKAKSSSQGGGVAKRASRKK